MIKKVAGRPPGELRNLVFTRALAPAESKTARSIFVDTGSFLFSKALEADVDHTVKQSNMLSHTASRLLCDALLGRASMRGVRVMAVELNLARVAGILPGDSGQQYDAFMNAASKGDFRDYLEAKYPVYFDSEKRRMALAVAHLSRIAAAAGRDRELLYSALDLAPFNRIVAVGPFGDSHRHGRRSAIVTFDTGQRVAYKPRSAANDRFYAHLAAKLQPHLPFSLRVPKAIDSADCSWQEYIQSAPQEVEPSSAAELIYWQKLGVWLAIGQATGLTDLHYENVIRADQDPIIIDFECALTSGRLEAANLEHLPDVLSVGILPRVVRAAGDDRYRNWGVIGRRESEPHIGRIHRPEADGTSRVRLVSTLAPEVPHTEVVSGAVIAVAHGRALSDGYEMGAQGLDAINGWVFKSGTQEPIMTRIVLRPTQTYMDAERVANFPRFYQSFDEYRDALRAALLEQDGSLPDECVSSEIDALVDGDVPIATISHGEVHLRVNDATKLEGLIGRTQRDSIAHGLRRTSDADKRRREQRAIWQSLAVLDSSCTPVGLYSGTSTTDLVEVFRSAATRITRSASIVDNIPTWVNAIPGNDAVRALDIGKSDLYRGSIGTLLAVAAANTVASDAGLSDFIHRSVIALCEWAASDQNPHSPGVFHGDAGFAFWIASMERFGYVCRETADAVVTHLFECILEHVDAAESPDLLSGWAGVLSVSRILGEAGYLSDRLDRLTDSACISRLRATARALPGVGFVWSEAENPWLGGLGHGVAGVAWSLSASRDARARELCLGAVHAQRTLWNPDARRWVDRRKEAAAGSVFNGWCHGADGILLAARSVPEVLPFSSVGRTEHIVEWLASPPVPDLSLCHGIAGRLDALCSVEMSPGDLSINREQVRQAARRVFREVLGDIQKSYIDGSGWGSLCDSLMLGAAGSLMAGARFVSRASVGSVLDLTLPVAVNVRS